MEKKNAVKIGVGIVAAVLAVAVMGAGIAVGNGAGRETNVWRGTPSSTDLPAPTVETAREVCEKAGNIWEEGDTEDEEDFYDQEFAAHITGVYYCDIGNYEERNEESFAFEVVTTDLDFNEIEYYREIISQDVANLPEGAMVFENSEAFFKMLVEDYSSYAFMAAYKTTGVEVYTMTLEKGHEVLTELGFPDVR